MGILDIVLLICFVPAIVSGVTKGFVRQVVEILAILVAAWVAFRFSSMMSVWLAQYIQLEKIYLHIICFVLIIIIVALIMNLLGRVLTKTLNVLSLGWLKYLLGFVFGILKVAIVLGLLILGFEALNANFNLVDPKELENAVVYNALKNIANVVFPYLKSFVLGING